ncbi:hypothetical protein H4R35_007084, partial [Dimargaris xerosporica]
MASKPTDLFDDELPFTVGSYIVDPKSCNRYLLQKRLGSGSYAVVFLAQCQRTYAQYAIKCLSKVSLSPDQLVLQRNEAALHQQVGHHRAVVALKRWFETSDWLFLVMEYVKGQDLYDWIMYDSFAHSSPSSESRREQAHRFAITKAIFMQTLDAVRFVHSRGVYHRDIKPENFILAPTHSVKLTDFGLATGKARSDEFECGSAPYMSPENRSTTRAFYSTAKSDIWALGIIFLNLFYGVTPWSEPDCQASSSFAAFMQDGVQFLIDRVGCPYEVARFLCQRVFCREIVRCTLQEFKDWCVRLPNVYFVVPASQRLPKAVSTMAASDYDSLSDLDVDSLTSTVAPRNIPIQGPRAKAQATAADLLVPSLAAAVAVPPAFSWADDFSDDDNDDTNKDASLDFHSTASTLVAPLPAQLAKDTLPAPVRRAPSVGFEPGSVDAPFSWADDDDDDEVNDLPAF